MSVHLSDIIKECKPKCDPNPCQNGAKCKELWNRFECVCENPWAYSGMYCEESTRPCTAHLVPTSRIFILDFVFPDINIGGMTLVFRDAFLKKNFLSNPATATEKSIIANLFNSSILVNIRTYDKDSVILYANDHVNNFVHLYISEGNTISFLFNYGNEIKNLSVACPGLFFFAKLILLFANCCT